jgi:hypothetical protein
MTFVVNVTSTDPIWFYCSLASHCQSGMSGVVNAPSGETIDMYKSAAQSVARASAPASPQGGVLETISTGAATTAASTTTGASTTKASTTSSMASGTTSAASSAATTKASAGGRNRDLSIAFGLTVVAGGLVALMA